MLNFLPFSPKNENWYLAHQNRFEKMIMYTYNWGVKATYIELLFLTIVSVVTKQIDFNRYKLIAARTRTMAMFNFSFKDIKALIQSQLSEPSWNNWIINWTNHWITEINIFVLLSQISIDIIQINFLRRSEPIYTNPHFKLM